MSRKLNLPSQRRPHAIPRSQLRHEAHRAARSLETLSPRATTVPVYSLQDAALTLLDGAIETLGSDKGDEAVHSARKSCKRIRAALRLLRGSVGDAVYSIENGRIRRAAKPLSAMRDAFILRRTLQTLPKQSPALTRGLGSEYRAERRNLQHRGARNALAYLKASREKLIDLPPIHSEIGPAIEGLIRSFKAGRNARRKAKNRDEEALHTWRKQAKYLLNELELLKIAFNVKCKRLRRQAYKLAEALGDDHDLFVLFAKLRIYDSQKKSLAKIIKKRRVRLQTRALRLGRKLYKHSAKHLEHKIAASVSTPRQLTSPHPN